MSFLNDDLIWKIFENAASQIAGRLLISVLRFFIIFIIVRQSGVEMAGNYGVILGLILLFESAVDFGMTDIVVRRLCQNSSHASGLIKNLIRAKCILAFVSASALTATIFILNYPPEMLLAGIIASIGLSFFGGILVFRSIFRSQLKMGREVMAELLGTLVSLPLFWLATHMEAGLIVLVGCYVCSRLAYLLLCLLWSTKELSEILEKPVTNDAGTRRLFTDALPIGVSDLVIGVYVTIDTLLISVLHNPVEAGLFFGSIRFISIIGIIAKALADTAYPVLSSFWEKSMTDFYFTMNSGFGVVAFIGGGGMMILYITAGFLLGLMGPEMKQAEDLFRLLSFYAFLRALSAYIGPLIIVSGGKRYATILTVPPIVTKVTFLFLLVPEYGAVGAAYSCILSELVNILSTSITSWLLIKKHLYWLAVLKVAMVAVIAIVAVSQINMLDTILGGGLAVIIYIILGYLFEVIPMRHTRKLIMLCKLRFSDAIEK